MGPVDRSSTIAWGSPLNRTSVSSNLKRLLRVWTALTAGGVLAAALLSRQQTRLSPTPSCRGLMHLAVEVPHNTLQPTAPLHYAFDVGAPGGASTGRDLKLKTVSGSAHGELVFAFTADEPNIILHRPQNQPRNRLTRSHIGLLQRHAVRVHRAISLSRPSSRPSLAAPTPHPTSSLVLRQMAQYGWNSIGIRLTSLMLHLTHHESASVPSLPTLRAAPQSVSRALPRRR